MATDYGGTPTRYGAMFGTAARAARTLVDACASDVLICESDEGTECPLADFCRNSGLPDPNAEDMADWLCGGYMDKRVRESLGY